VGPGFAAGFEERNWMDDTQACIEWFHARMAAQTPDVSPPVGYDLVVPNFPEKGRNVLRNLKDNRITVIQAVFDRTG